MASIRPLTNEERQTLIAKAGNPVTVTGVLLVAALCSAVSMGSLYVADRVLGFLSPHFPILFVIIIVAWLVYGIRSYRNLRRGFSLTPYQNDLAGGVAEVTRFHATKAIRFEEWEDGGGGYFIHLKDGHTLFLRGQYLFDLEENRKFPCSEFEVARGPNSGAIVNLVCCGAYFPSQKLAAPFMQPSLKMVPTDGEVIEVPWEKIDRMPT